MRTIDFYQKHLNQTSRSFAFCIEQLDGPFRLWISLSYLLCRVLDTIEDDIADAELQKAQYEGFRQFLMSPADSQEIESWISRFPKSELAAYSELIADSTQLFQDLHELSPRVRDCIQQNILKMQSGMGVYSSRSRDGILRLVNLIDVNRYCYFVAGVVGDLITQLYTSVRPELKWNSKLNLNSNHFGLFLQKVNLLKDQAADEMHGRFLVPDRKALFASLEKNARGALEYLISLPTQDRGFRLFCAWSIFLGLASLSLMQNDDGQKIEKISRAKTKELCAQVALMIDDNEQLKSAFGETLTHIEKSLNSSNTPAVDPWLSQLVGDKLSESDLHDLGMC